MDQNSSQGLRLNCGFVEKLSIYAEVFGGDSSFAGLVMYLGRNFLKATENFHTQNNSCIYPVEVRVPFLLH